MEASFSWAGSCYTMFRYRTSDIYTSDCYEVHRVQWGVPTLRASLKLFYYCFLGQ
jgi:hypothetical protein